MEPKLLSVEKIVTIVGDKIDSENQGCQSYVNFYKIAQKDIDVIKNEIDIDIDIETDIIVKKQFITSDGVAEKEKGGKKGQYNREKQMLLKLQHDSHFPTILCVDDETTTIYMTYCGNRIKNEENNIPNNWKEQIREILSTLQKNKIYNNDMWIENYLIKDGIIYLIDFGWATMDNEDYPYINITEKDLQEHDDLFKLLDIVFKRITRRRKKFDKRL